MAKTFNERVAIITAKLTTVADVTKLAKSIKGRAENLDVDMHAAGIGALFCAMTHKDTSATVAVINSLGKHTRAKAFAEWVERFSNIVLVLDKKTDLWAGKMLPAADRRDDPALAKLLEAATAEPFWTPAEKSSRDFSLHAALAMLLKKAEGERTKGNLSDDDRVALVELAAIADKVKPVAAPAAPVAPVEPVEASADQSAALANAGADALETVG
ncbi:hypothetical protein SPS_12 [Sphingomonas phage Scott]|uniref:Uncharacterized protein n=1 Tax=Sphingomonas phage Scott TaxID=2282912 RepID=A0A346FDA9_9CAUD|nr:hypothetical protein HOT83_gp12 [Sphingomonas phage Scott]AXN53723.1 hypothetical protein SPS_12 [Sphingomonas phage Scott]